MGDKLSKAALDALPHPLIASLGGGNEWPIHDICVETGLTRIDVVGKLQTVDFAEILGIFDGDGLEHDADQFYIEDETGNDMHTDTDKQIEALIARRSKLESTVIGSLDDAEDVAERITDINLQIMKLQGKQAGQPAEPTPLDGITTKTVWTTKDGKTWDRLEDAITHQRRGKVIEAIYDADGFRSEWLAIHAEQIADNAAALFAILEPFFRKGE